MTAAHTLLYRVKMVKGKVCISGCVEYNFHVNFAVAAERGTDALPASRFCAPFSVCRST